MKGGKHRWPAFARRALLRATWRRRRKKLGVGVSAFFSSVPRLRKGVCKCVACSARRAIFENDVAGRTCVVRSGAIVSGILGSLGKRFRNDGLFLRRNRPLARKYILQVRQQLRPETTERDIMYKRLLHLSKQDSSNYCYGSNTRR